MLRKVLLVIAFIAPFVIAEICQTGLAYCGFNLLLRGNYQDQIDKALEDDNLSTDARTADNTLFNCIGGPDGSIKVIRYCGHNCEDGGLDNSDYCGGESSSSGTTSASSAISTTASSTSAATSTSGVSNQNNNNSSSGGTPVGAIVGGVVGGLAAIGLIGLVAFLFFRQRTKSQEQQHEPSVNHGSISQATPFNNIKAKLPPTQNTMIHEAPTNSDARHELA